MVSSEKDGSSASKTTLLVRLMAMAEEGRLERLLLVGLRVSEDGEPSSSGVTLFDEEADLCWTSISLVQKGHTATSFIVPTHEQRLSYYE